MTDTKLRLPLFLTRLGIFYFLLPWQVMRFTKPDSISSISNKYYNFNMPEIGSMISGIFMMALLLAFVTGFKKRISYGLVFLFHAIGTLMTLPFIIPFVGLENYNQLFLAAVPTAFAMLLLYCLRDQDTLFTLDK